MSESITQGNFRASMGAAVVSFNVTDDLAQVERDLKNAYGAAMTVLKSMMPVEAKPTVTEEEVNEKVKSFAKAAQKAAEAVAPTAKAAEAVTTTAKEAITNAPALVTIGEPTITEVVNYTLADVRKSLGTIIDLGHRPAAEQYVQYHCKTKRTSEIPAEQYPAMMADLEEMAEGLASGKYSGYDSFAKAKGYELTPEAEG